MFCEREDRGRRALNLLFDLGPYSRLSIKNFVIMEDLMINYEGREKGCFDEETGSESFSQLL